MASTDNLAQASLPHLGEMSGGSPRAFCASCRSGDQNLVLSEQMSRLGEGVSPKCDCVGDTVLLVELSPRRREARLSENPSGLSGNWHEQQWTLMVDNPVAWY